MFKLPTIILTITFLLHTISANDIHIEENQIKSEPIPAVIINVKKTLHRDCANRYSTTCLKLDIVSFVDKLNENDNYNVLPGVSVVKENISDSVNTADIVADLAKEFPDDPDARLDAFMMKKVTGYLNSHSVRLNLWKNNESTGVSARKGGGGGGGGGGGKKGGGMGGLLAAAAMMKATLMAVAMGGLAALAGKALMTAMISLVLSAVIGLKSLTSGGGKHTTYEVISKPVYSHSNTHSVSHEEHGGGGGGGYGHSGYGRSFDELPLPLGLQPNYKPA